MNTRRFRKLSATILAASLCGMIVAETASACGLLRRLFHRRHCAERSYCSYQEEDANPQGADGPAVPDRRAVPDPLGDLAKHPLAAQLGRAEAPQPVPTIATPPSSNARLLTEEEFQQLLRAEQSNSDTEQGESGESANARSRELRWRVWTHQDGRTAELALLDIRDGSAVLQRRDGQIGQTLVADLSAADQGWIRRRSPVVHLAVEPVAAAPAR